MISRPTLLLNLVLYLSILQVKGQSWAKQSQIWAKPGCPEKCGDITIPYPFGMNSGSCYLNPWFEITCNKSSTNSTKSLPFLSKINLEVLNISANEGTITVNHPIVSTCNDQRWEIDLTGSSFLCSYNWFIAVGCDNLAVLKNQTGETLTGCTSVCPDSSVTDDKGCFGINCCHTTASSLTTYKVDISSSGVQNSDGKCKYAFLVSREWLTETNLSAAVAHNIVQNMISVPVELYWYMETDKNITDITDDDCIDEVASIYALRSTDDDGKNFYNCWCPYRDYVGNPYLLGGCKGPDTCSNGTCDGRCEPIRSIGYKCNPPKSRIKDIIIGVTTSFGPMISLITSFLMYRALIKRRNRKLKQKFFKRNGGLLLEQEMSLQDGKVEKTKVFSSEELEKATDHFNANRVLGHGGQGTVYKGMLTDGKIVAVKKSLIMDESQVEQFINEVVILSQINHRNVVHLFGCCLETKVPLLVYEFIPNGTLFEHIHNRTNEFPMLWESRLLIATEIANALAYLHSSTSMPIYHRDIKSTNILLDDKYRAKISDFGTSKSIPMEQTHLTTLVQGTFGYLDPEYFQTSQFTDKSDVYSFGVVLVELLTGQKPITWTKSQEERSLATFFLVAMEENRVFDILDPQLLKEKKNGELVAVAKLAKLCLNLSGKRRPTMKEVAMELEKIQKSAPYKIVHETVQQDMHGPVEYIATYDATTSSAPLTIEFSNYSLASSVDDKPLLFDIK